VRLKVDTVRTFNRDIDIEIFRPSGISVDDQAPRASSGATSCVIIDQRSLLLLEIKYKLK
jgi:hypothetical protein